jgi:hypothetical protein
VSPSLVYKKFKYFGGFKIGRVIRFDQDRFEIRIREVMDDSLQTQDGRMDISLRIGETANPERRVQDKAGGPNSGSRSSQEVKRTERRLRTLVCGGT